MDIHGIAAVCGRRKCQDKCRQLVLDLDDALSSQSFKRNEIMTQLISSVHKLALLLFSFFPTATDLKRIVGMSAYTPFVIKMLVLDENGKADAVDLTTLALVATTSFPCAPSHSCAQRMK